MGFNFKEVGESAGGDFSALPEGRYDLTVNKAELITASTGTKMVKVEFGVENEKFKNRKLWHNFALTSKSMVYLYNFLKAAGSSLVDQEDVEPVAIAKSLTGLKVSAFTEPGMTPNGNAKNDLSKWMPLTGGSTTKGDANSGSLFE